MQSQEKPVNSNPTPLQEAWNNDEVVCIWHIRRHSSLER
jgi:hypothetical protein